MAHKALKAHIPPKGRLRRILPHIGRIGRLRRTLPPQNHCAGTRTGAPGSPKRTWAENDGRSPSIVLSKVVIGPRRRTPLSLLIPTFGRPSIKPAASG